MQPRRASTLLHRGVGGAEESGAQAAGSPHTSRAHKLKSKDSNHGLERSGSGRESLSSDSGKGFHLADLHPSNFIRRSFTSSFGSGSDWLDSEQGIKRKNSEVFEEGFDQDFDLEDLRPDSPSRSATRSSSPPPIVIGGVDSLRLEEHQKQQQQQQQQFNSRFSDNEMEQTYHFQAGTTDAEGRSSSNKYEQPKGHRSSSVSGWLCSKTTLQLLLITVIVVACLDRIYPRPVVLDEQTQHYIELMKANADLFGAKPQTPAPTTVRLPAQRNETTVKSTAPPTMKKKSSLALRLEKLETLVQQQSETIADLHSEMLGALNTTGNMILQQSRKMLENSLLDSSEVHKMVLQNLELYGEKRWVFPCEYEGCRRARQSEITKTVMKSLPPDKRRKSEKEKLRVVHIGSCSPHLIQDILSSFQDRLSQYVIVEPLLEDAEENKLLCGGKGPADAKTFSSRVKEWAKKYPSANVELVTSSIGSAVGNFDAKYLDVVFLDSPPEEATAYELSPNSKLGTWFDKIRNDGVILGHQYGIRRYGSNHSFPGVEASWLDTNTKLPRRLLQKVKDAVDKLLHNVKEKSDGNLRVAGDTIWYIYKRKVTLGNIFNLRRLV